MSDTATDLTPPVQEQTPPPEPEPQAQAQGDGDPAPLNLEDAAAVDEALSKNAIDVPDGGRLYSGEEVGKIAQSYRMKLKEKNAEIETLRPGSARAQELEQQIAHLQTQLQQVQPYVQAYQAMTQAAQQAAPNPQDDAEAEEYAKLLDLYAPDGKPDLERGKKGLALQRRLAEQAAQQHVAPIQQQTVQSQSAYNLARAKNTQLPNGTKVDPAMLDMVWQRVGPELTATPEGAQQALVVAAGYTSLVASQAPQTTQLAANGQFQSQPPIPPPMFTEKAGGKAPDVVGGELSAADKAYCKSAGISEKDFIESARKAPWLRRS